MHICSALDFFFKIIVFVKSLRNIIRVSKSLDKHVGPVLGPNCLRRSLAEITCRQEQIRFSMYVQSVPFSNGNIHFCLLMPLQKKNVFNKVNKS